MKIIQTRKIRSIMIISSIIIMVISASLVGGGWNKAETGCPCHGTNDPATIVNVTGLPVEYMHDRIYNLNLSVTGSPVSNMGGFNFEVSAGRLSSTDPNVRVSGDYSQATYKYSIARNWTVSWKAPIIHTGTVNFWMAASCVDNSSGTANDTWNKDMWAISELLPEAEAPQISNVRLNGASNPAYLFSSIPTLTLTAMIDDSFTGNSNISGANYTTGQRKWVSSASMSSSPAPSSIKNYSAQIPTPSESGIYNYYVYGWDEHSNFNDTNIDMFAKLDIIDDIPPSISNLSLNGKSSVAAYQGEMINLLAIINDSISGNSTVISSNYTIGYQDWNTGQPMMPIDAVFDSPIEQVGAIIDTTGLIPGTYSVYVYGEDEDSNCNVTPVCNSTLEILRDQTPPEIMNPTINGMQSAEFSLSSIPETLELIVSISDSNTGNSDIIAVNFTDGQNNWPSSTIMHPLHPPISQHEIFYANLTQPWKSGLFRYYVYAGDSSNNFNVTDNDTYAELKILDDIYPDITQITLDCGIPAIVNEGDEVIIKLTVDDTACGNSLIKGLNMTLGENNWPSSVEGVPDSGLLDSPIENFTFIINTTDWSPGDNILYFYSTDQPILPGSSIDTPHTVNLTITLLPEPVISEDDIETEEAEGTEGVNFNSWIIFTIIIIIVFSMLIIKYRRPN